LSQKPHKAKIGFVFWVLCFCDLFRAFRFSFESGEMLSVFVFAAKHMVKGDATLTSFALGTSKASFPGKVFTHPEKAKSKLFS